MTLNIEVTPRAEAWLAAQAVEQGLPPADIVNQLIDAQLPANELPEPLVPVAQAIDARNAAAIAYLDARIQADATTDPEEILKAEAEFEELKRNLNANRKATNLQCSSY